MLRVVVVITPPNIPLVGVQNVQALKDWGISGVALSAETISEDVIKVCGLYRSIISTTH